MKSRFPHNSREIAARVAVSASRIALWSMLTALFGVNLFTRLNSSLPYWQQALLALRYPYTPEVHRSLARSYWDNGLFQSTKTELAYISTLERDTAPPTGVLGASTDEISLWKTRQETLKHSYDGWLQIVNQKPDYRDGLLILASLAYEQSQSVQAHAFAEQAFILDPNSPLANKLLNLTASKK